ncbi:DnaJ domain-containing protein [Ostreococcus tauri]|uniref:DnaJ domain-containing protein n=1 Tax=Ostreococcus tauri TaxID=70448 RepID=A0A1Y5I5U7_OSTTA|nr:DnaJ domain-containing protein [Ostreococcus tauri]
MDAHEADRCCDVAENALETARSRHDLDKAERFADKALRIDPKCARARKIKSRCASRSKRGFDAGTSSERTETRTETATGRTSREAEAQTRGGAAASGKGTPEQERLIAGIKRAGNDYYKVLGLEKGSGEVEVKKAYKKMALKLHPDKCRAAGAEDAFKLVNKAFACLSDPQKRAAFDRYGSDEPSAGGFGGAGVRRRPGGAQGFDFDADIDPAEIFNMFFNGGMGGFGGPGFRVHTFGGNPFGAQHRHHQHRRQHPGAAGGGPGVRVDDGATIIRNILHLLPLLLPLLMWLLTPAEDDFSMIRSSDFPHLVKSERMNIPFYVNKQKFEQKYPVGDQRKSVHRRIENDIIMRHRRQCDYERQSWTSKRPSCEYLRTLQAEYPSYNVYSAW